MVSPFGEGRKGNNVEIIVYVPSTTKRKGKDVFIGASKFNKRKNEVSKFLSKSFGGMTRVKAQGGWVNEKGDLVKEQVAKVETSTNLKDYKKSRIKLLNFIKRKKKAWKQDAIGYYFNVEDVNEGLHFI